MRHLLAEFLKISHLLIVAFVLFGWASPFFPLLAAHLIFVPLMILQWRLANDECLLTRWENRLRNKPPSEQFIRPILIQVFGAAPEKQMLDKMIRIITWASWLITLWRFSKIKGF